MVGNRSARGSFLAVGLVLALTLAESVAASERVSVAIQSTVIDGEDADLLEVSRAARAIAEEKVQLVDETVWRNALGSDSAACLDSEDCILRAVERSGATHVLQVTVAPYAPRVTVTTRVVDRNGDVVRGLRTVEVQPGPEGERAQLVRKTLGKVISAMALEELVAPEGAAKVEPVRAVERDPGRVSEPVAMPPASSSASILRFAKYGAFGLGTAAAIGGLAFALQAQSTAAELDSRLVGGALPDRNEDTRELLRRSDSQRTQAIIVSSVGGVLLATGVVLSLLTGEEGPKVAAEIGHDSAGVRVSGTF